MFFDVFNAFITLKSHITENFDNRISFKYYLQEKKKRKKEGGGGGGEEEEEEEDEEEEEEEEVEEVDSNSFLYVAVNYCS